VNVLNFNVLFCCNRRDSGDLFQERNPLSVVFGSLRLFPSMEVLFKQGILERSIFHLISALNSHSNADTFDLN
jgi:hypothetical protein